MHKKSIGIVAFCFIYSLLQAIPPGPTDFPGGPGPIFSFGQNVLSAQKFLQRASGFYVEADNGQFLGWSFSSIYGITDNLTVLVAPLWIPVNKFDGISNTGLGFISFQGEYAFYNHHTPVSHHQMTIVAAVRAPPTTTPFVTFWTPKSPAYFLGLTQSHRSKHWYAYSSFGGHLTTTYKGQKPGNRFVFDIGCGPTFLDKDDTFLSLIAECSSFYQTENQPVLVSNVDSCPHFIFFGTTLYFAHDHFFMYVGYQYPIVQTCSDPGDRINYRFSISLSWLF